MKNDNFITIQGWMVNELKLKSNELMCYALIYGFSQDSNSKFSGSTKYIAQWMGCSKSTVKSVLKSLVSKNLLIKHDKNIKGFKLCDYTANRPEINTQDMGGSDSDPGVGQELTQGGLDSDPINYTNNYTHKERENPAQKNSETEWDGEVNLNIPSLKDRQRKQQKDAYATTTAIDFLRNNYPSRYEQQFKMKFSHKIKDQKRFISNFNDTVEIEGLAYESRKLFARLNKYATNWVENQGKFSNKPKGGKTGML